AEKLHQRSIGRATRGVESVAVELADVAFDFAIVRPPLDRLRDRVAFGAKLRLKVAQGKNPLFVEPEQAVERDPNTSPWRKSAAFARRAAPKCLDPVPAIAGTRPCRIRSASGARPARASRLGHRRLQRTRLRRRRRVAAATRRRCRLVPAV